MREAHEAQAVREAHEALALARAAGDAKAEVGAVFFCFWQVLIGDIFVLDLFKGIFYRLYHGIHHHFAPKIWENVFVFLFLRSFLDGLARESPPKWPKHSEGFIS